jgi:hypothetical protein
MSCEILQSLWKSVWWLFRKLNIYLLYHSTVALPEIHPKQVNIRTQIHVFTYILSRKNCEKVERTQVSIDGWINKLVYIFPMQVYSS